GIHEDIGSITARIRGTDSSELPICQQKKAVWLSQFEIATLLIFEAENVRDMLALSDSLRLSDKQDS
ncbi:MAG: hypothetical protein WAW72_03550, partial [Trichococcus flocculiformis]